MRIARMSAVVVAALCVCLVASIVMAAPARLVQSTTLTNAESVTLVYDPVTGTLNVNAINKNNARLTTLQLESDGSKLLYENTAWYKPLNDDGDPNPTNADAPNIAKADKIFRLATAGFSGPPTGTAPSGYSIGRAPAGSGAGLAMLPTGLTASQVIADLLIDGSMKPEGGVTGGLDAYGQPAKLFVVPEPSSVALLALGLLGLVGLRRR